MIPSQLLIILFFIVALVALLWWLLVATEGVYLGRRVVIRLYDLYATRYDDIKHFHPEFEHWLLSNPIMAAIDPHVSPLVLDAATGTGRLPLTLCDNAMFQGRIVGVDLSRQMLHEASKKLHLDQNRVDLICCSADRLPFADATFDVVTCLEALEFTPDPAATLAELVRVLRPGGLLLVTNRIGWHLMPRYIVPRKTWKEAEVHALLENLGMVNVTTEPWQTDYQKIWAEKDGHSLVSGARPLDEILRCPVNDDALMVRGEHAWTCPACGAWVPVGADGVIEIEEASP